MTLLDALILALSSLDAFDLFAVFLLSAFILLGLAGLLHFIFFGSGEKG